MCNDSIFNPSFIIVGIYIDIFCLINPRLLCHYIDHPVFILIITDQLTANGTKLVTPSNNLPNFQTITIT